MKVYTLLTRHNLPHRRVSSLYVSDQHGGRVLVNDPNIMDIANAILKDALPDPKMAADLEVKFAAEVLSDCVGDTWSLYHDQIIDWANHHTVQLA